LSTSKAFSEPGGCFALRSGHGTRHYFAHTDLPGSPGDPAVEVTRGEWVPPRAVHISHFKGSANPGDVIWTSDFFPLIVSQRVIDVLEANAVTGWRTYPVVVHNKAKAVVPGYHGLAITGRCGFFDGTRSRVVLRDYPAALVEERVGYHLDEASWDGSDIFCSIAGSGMKLCTAAVKEVLERAKVRNLSFEPISDLTIHNKAILATFPPLARIPKLPDPKQPG